MKTQYKPLAMKCTQEQFDSIKDMIPLPIEKITFFLRCNYLVNNLGGNKVVSNIMENDKHGYCREVLEHFDGKYFIECCGVEVLEDVSEQIWKGSELQMRFPDDTEWLNLEDDVEYRIKPKPSIVNDIEALQRKAKELGINITILIE